MARRVTLVVGLLFAAVVVAFTVNAARAFRERVFDDPRAKTKVTTRTPEGDVAELTWAAAVLKRAGRTQMSPPIYWLVNQSITFLWATIYGAIGFLGGCIYLLLLVVDPTVVKRSQADVPREFQFGRLVARLAVATAAGVLAYFVVILPAGVAILPLKSLGAKSSDVYASLLLLPAVAGIFTSTFLERLARWLERVMAGTTQPANKGVGK